jgi:hypothetical protein
MESDDGLKVFPNKPDWWDPFETDVDEPRPTHQEFAFLNGIYERLPFETRRRELAEQYGMCGFPSPKYFSTWWRHRTSTRSQALKLIQAWKVECGLTATVEMMRGHPYYQLLGLVREGEIASLHNLTREAAIAGDLVATACFNGETEAANCALVTFRFPKSAWKSSQVLRFTFDCNYGLRDGSLYEDDREIRWYSIDLEPRLTDCPAALELLLKSRPDFELSIRFGTLKVFYKSTVSGEYCDFDDYCPAWVSQSRRYMPLPNRETFVSAYRPTILSLQQADRLWMAPDDSSILWIGAWGAIRQCSGITCGKWYEMGRDLYRRGIEIDPYFADHARALVVYN